MKGFMFRATAADSKIFFLGRIFYFSNFAVATVVYKNNNSWIWK